jgi:arylsulfatase
VAAIEVPPGGAEGVVLAQGGRFGGFSLYMKKGEIRYAYNFAGMERTVLAAALGPGRHTVAVDLAPTSGLAMHCDLYVDGAAVAAADLPRTAPVCFALAGEGLCCGFDDGTPVSEDYESPFDFTGVIDGVVIDVGGTPVLDLDLQVRRAWVTQ